MDITDPHKQAVREAAEATAAVFDIDPVITAYLAAMECAEFPQVPEVPTADMIAAASRIPHARDEEIYAAMISARPRVQS